MQSNTLNQALPNDVLKIICSYERCVFKYVNKMLHAEYIKWDTWVYRNCIVKTPERECRLNVMLVWYEFAERRNVKLYRYIIRTMWPEVRSEMSTIYDRACNLKWQSYYRHAKALVWHEFTRNKST